MNIKLNNKFSSLLITCFVSLLCSVFISCKSSDVSKIEEIYNKQLHPREYYFDIVENGEKQHFSKNKKTGKLECIIDFTEFVEDDLPLAGDKLIFIYKGYSYKNIPGNIFASIEQSKNGTDNQKRLFASNLNQKEIFEDRVSFILKEDLDELKLKLSFEDAMKYSKIYFKYERVIKSTDTADEKKALAKAEKKGYKINELRAEIVDDYAEPETEEKLEIQAKDSNLSENESTVITVIPEKTPEEIAAEEQAKKKQEEKELAEEQAQQEYEKKLEEEKLERERQEKELKEQQELLEKTIKEITNTNVKRYEKEYLNDYAVDEYTFDMDEVNEEPENILPNPNEADKFGKTLLMEAAQEGNDWQLNALLNAKADVNLKDKDGWTALMYAVRYQANMDCVNLLIEHGADVKAKNNFGTSALVLAANYNNNPEILKKLLSYYSPTDPDVMKSFISVLTESHESEYIQIIKVNLFLDLSVPLNSFHKGKTPLMYAAELGNSTNIIQLLLDNNSITTIRSTEGKTAFDYAKENPKLRHDDIFWSLNSK